MKKLAFGSRSESAGGGETEEARIGEEESGEDTAGRCFNGVVV